MLVVPDSSQEPPMVVNLPMLDTSGASGELVNPPKAKGAGKGAGKDAGGKKARRRASKLPPACFTAFSKLAAAPAVGSLELNNTATPPQDQWEDEDNKGE